MINHDFITTLVTTHGERALDGIGMDGMRDEIQKMLASGRWPTSGHYINREWKDEDKRNAEVKRYLCGDLIDPERTAGNNEKIRMKR